ncbi:FMN-binding negative transcriptional regulator [Ciceribacter ferrooxidans]|uniref:FMN-binding negative transcriptional regulator n=1 Tax=Ciceribacter ferrooxidans TaxID=2509717 RepID=A0A4Q2T0Z4_9HYPH|nr:FMN-binding negative transcriptional regulator [Ciceribacter ferrooxidans]RYC11633.1 FMN-binding negative transcriptional regulator [Ciceribacter ferrooxidans]
MYQPPHHREDRREVQHALIRSHPLGLLISSGEGGLLANPIPFRLVNTDLGMGTLQAHMARANPQWRALAAGAEVLIVFQGADHYITPAWYETKRETGKVVPTWNYAIVQVRGTVRVIEDSQWLRAQVNRLTDGHESRRMIPWAVGDAPDDFITAQLKGIVGIEVQITAIEGKWKVSQNRNEADRRGVAEGLDAEGSETAGAMAGMVREWGGL